MAMPAYRYVPGLQPHPFRTPGGHSYTDGSPPSPEGADFLHACDLFDQRYWWESHEVWEAIWHTLPKADPARDLVQSLIQVAASLLKRHMGSDGAADRLMARARARLSTVRDAAGDTLLGIDLAAWDAALDGHRTDDSWPVLPMA